MDPMLILGFWQFLLTLLLGLFVKSLVPAYFAKKGENLATKEDIEEITKKVEAVRIEYAKLQHKSQFAFEKEFDILSEVWEALFDLQVTTMSLRPVFDTYDPAKSEEQRKQERLEKFVASYNAYAKIVMSRKPFYPNNIFTVLEKIRILALTESNEYKILSNQNRADYWDKAIKNQDAIIKCIDDVGELIRQRYSA